MGRSEDARAHADSARETARIAVGKTDAEIAGRFGGGVKRVVEERARLLQKLGIKPDEIGEAAERLASWVTYRGVT